MTSTFYVNPTFTWAAPIFTTPSKVVDFKINFKDDEDKGQTFSFLHHKRIPSVDICAKSVLRLNAKKQNSVLSCLTVTHAHAHAPVCLATSGSDLVVNKLERLVSEFRSLSEPIDRVKRLLQYAAFLPPMDDSGRVPENRVMGCTTQVWLESRLDETGRIRFRVDSDSEITKGFCSCLIWMLDGAQPEEVLMVKSEDLVDMNVGFHGKAQSRVNTWHNVLISMQKNTRDLILEREGNPCFIFTDCHR